VSAKLKAHHVPAMLAALTALASLMAMAGIVLWQRWLPAALWHLVFAVGTMPMIFAAMAYFTPVLTRTPAAPRELAIVPATAVIAGCGIVGWFAHGIEILRQASPWLALATTLSLSWWIARRRNACLGRPHAGFWWYAAALLCLALGLIAVGLSAQLPEHAPALRAFHLHINTLGFMGLTAIGTLQVLLPTVFSQPDPDASGRLARDLPWSVAGAFAIAIGASWWWPLAAIGAFAYLWPILRLVRASLHTYGKRLWSAGHAAPLLLAAIAGMTMLLLHGLAHGVTVARTRDALPLFMIAFLLPLVSGAVTQLLPVWLHPGTPGDRHKSQRRRLAAFARTRAALLACGGLLAAFGLDAGYPLGMIGALWLIGAMANAVLREFRSRG
jgi:hypothetical protein